MGPRKSQGTIQPGPTQFQLEMYMNSCINSKSFALYRTHAGGGGGGGEGLTLLSVPSHARELGDIERVDA